MTAADPARQTPGHLLLVDMLDDKRKHTIDRAFRLLSLRRVAEVVEPGEAEGPPIPGTLSLRDALDEALWSGRPALPVANAEGRIIGRLTLEALARLGARPQ